MAETKHFQVNVATAHNLCSCTFAFHTRKERGLCPVGALVLGGTCPGSDCPYTVKATQWVGV